MNCPICNKTTEFILLDSEDGTSLSFCSWKHLTEWSRLPKNKYNLHAFKHLGNNITRYLEKRIASLTEEINSDKLDSESLKTLLNIRGALITELDIAKEYYANTNRRGRTNRSGRISGLVPEIISKLKQGYGIRPLAREYHIAKNTIISIRDNPDYPLKGE